MTNEETAPLVTSLAPWFGGKRTLAPAIIEEFGPHRAYWEPFCGSMSLVLSKPECSHETVNDLHGDLINLARVVQSPTLAPQLYRRLRRVLFDERAFAEAVDRLGVPSVGLDRAFDYFVFSWFGRNGVAGTTHSNTHFCRRYTKNGGHAAKRFESAVRSIPAWRRRLRNVTILSADGIELLDRVEDAAGTVVYCDPPYLRKGASYLHDFDWLAHRRLAKALRRFTKTRVVVSYYAHPDLSAMYPGWTVREVFITKTMATSGQRTAEKQVAPEVLLINGPSVAAEGAA